MTAKQTVKQFMIKSRKWWNVNDLTREIRYHLPINHSTVERYIREFREPKHLCIVRKKKVGKATFLYKVEKLK